MLKISSSKPLNHAVVLRLEGRVVGPWVTELQKSCEEVLTGGGSLELGLADVEFMDAQGAALLLSLERRGVALLECPPFATEQLKATATKGAWQ